MVTFGIEEEMMLLGPATLRPAPSADQAMEWLQADTALAPFISREYLASQLEFSSPVFSYLDEAACSLRHFRRRVADAAETEGAIAASVGMPFDAAGSPAITDTDRYHNIAADYGAITTDHQINALHIHVGTSSREAGVRILNRVRVWIPTLLALSGNSPYWNGKDTGFASWRSLQMRRWTTNGCPPQFTDADDYARRTQLLLGVGGTRDLATIAWNVRLSEAHPTIEFRVFDAQLGRNTTLTFAALCRALVTTLETDNQDANTIADAAPPELLDSALWLAARDGITGQLLHPDTNSLAPAKVVADALLTFVRDALEDAGDLGMVQETITRLFLDGAGAERQRRSYGENGLAGLRDLVRTALVADQ